MTVKATIATGYRLRLLLMSVMMLGFGVYCVYDGHIAYPKTKEIGLSYAELRENYPDDFPERWPDLAASNGWPTKVPKKVKSEADYDSDIMTQWIMAGIVLPLGLFFGYKLLRESFRWVAMDEATGLTASGGHDAPWDTLTGLERGRWKTKGIAQVQYRDGASGKAKQILLDDFKSDRLAIGQIYDAVLTRVDPEAAAAEAAARAAATEASAELAPVEETHAAAAAEADDTSPSA